MEQRNYRLALGKFLLKVKYGHLEKTQQNIDEFIRWLEIRGNKPQTILRRTQDVNVFLKTCKNKDLQACWKRKLEDFIRHLNKGNRKTWGVYSIKRSLRMFFGHFYGYESVAWLKENSRNIESVKTADLVGSYEIQQMVEHSDNMRDKAIATLLWDTGIRRGELLSMKISSVDVATMHITVTGKTGERTIPLTFSGPTIKQYLNSIGRLGNGDYALWYGQKRKGVSALSERGLRLLLLRMAKAAAIKKRVYPHLIRHSAATRDAKRYTEAILRYKYGWKKDSDMTSLYVHISAKDLDEVMGDAAKMPDATILDRLARIEANQKIILAGQKLNTP